MTATVGLAVTDAGQGVAYGDYFTALELAAELEKAGLRVIYLRRHAGDWYCEAAKCETVISLLESFNPEKIKSTDSQSRPLCIAWARNWFDRWREAKGIHSYDLLLASSETAAAYLSSETGLNAELFPLATSAPRFYQKAGVTAYQRDLCFTGSYWYKPREIERLLDVSRLSNYRLDIFGENWENSEKFSSFWRGFLDYEALPEVYKTTKIVLDDANFATKPYGAVNSRVYDALAAGALVLTNGGLGAKETFNGLLPVYSSSEELHRQIDFYLSDEEARLAKILELQDFVLAQHTYAHRVTQLLKLLAQNKSLPDSRGGH
ncbi:MAG: glycosyltransferase [Gammaproteobacteria bacterium]|nr:glycosyltransferase [Gammaproteobacteria bacterium]